MPGKEKTPPGAKTADREKPKSDEKPAAHDDILTSAAKAIGTAAGKVATLVGAHPAAETAPKASVKPAKLVKKNKSRLPRREKKRRMKAAAAANSEAGE